MAIYAIGDVQGCYDQLRQLLDKLVFDDTKDKLWFSGDLVNRGPKSLKTLRFVKSLGDTAVTVLGNHDLHLLSAYFLDSHRRSRKDTLDNVLAAKDVDDLMYWLLHRPFIHRDEENKAVLVHAGLPPQWTIKKSMRQARKLEKLLQGDTPQQLLKQSYRVSAPHWNSSLSYWERRCHALAAFTRMRYVYENGKLEMNSKGKRGTQASKAMPWFEHPKAKWRGTYRVVFGHWSTLGEIDVPDVIHLDGGCVWGGYLNAARLTTSQEVEYTQVKCKQSAIP